MIDRATAIELIRDKPWHHDFEIVPGVRTRGTYEPSRVWDKLRLPADLTGLTLADVGASNGYFSFEARKRGAKVTAFDFRHKDNSGFGLVQHVNGMRDIEHHQVNVLNITSADYGTFDIVLGLGLLYHVADPYRALANCCGLAKGRLLLESHCVDASIPPPLNREPVMKQISDPTRFPQWDHLRDPSVFWSFTSVCLERMLEDLGFAVKRTDVEGDRVVIDSERSAASDQTRLHLAYGKWDRVPVGADRDDPNSWKIF